MYTNVAFYRKWILDTISKNSSPEELARYSQNRNYDDEDDDDDCHGSVDSSEDSSSAVSYTHLDVYKRQI